MRYRNRELSRRTTISLLSSTVVCFHSPQQFISNSVKCDPKPWYCLVWINPIPDNWTPPCFFRVPKHGGVQLSGIWELDFHKGPPLWNAKIFSRLRREIPKHGGVQLSRGGPVIRNRVDVFLYCLKIVVELCKLVQPMKCTRSWKMLGFAGPPKPLKFHISLLFDGCTSVHNTATIFKL